ncbi:DUF664 domain-containing protein [Catenulispora yoronensis]
MHAKTLQSLRDSSAYLGTNRSLTFQACLRGSTPDRRRRARQPERLPRRRPHRHPGQLSGGVRRRRAPCSAARLRPHALRRGLHLRWAEATWFEVALRGERDRAPAQDYLADPDVPLALLLDEYDAQCDLSRVIASTLSLDTSVACAGTRYNVRWILLHMLEETRRVLGLIEAVRELLVGDPVAG